MVEINLIANYSPDSFPEPSSATRRLFHRSTAARLGASSWSRFLVSSVSYTHLTLPTKEQRQAILAAQRLRGLRERFNSGRLSDDDKRELQRLRKIRGASDVDEQIRELNKNRDQLDAQSREAVDLWNSLRVADDGSGKDSEE